MQSRPVVARARPRAVPFRRCGLVRMSLRQRNPHWREAQRPEDAPALWQRVTHAAQSCSVLRALAALQAASPAEVEEAQQHCASLGLIVPAIRAAGARKTKTSAPPAELLAFVELALQRGFSPDASCPQIMAWEISSPPLVTAAAYGYDAVCALLLRGGASPEARNSDGDTALHAVEHPHVLRLLLGAPGFRALVGAQNNWSLTPLVSALTASPFKAKHLEAAHLLASTSACEISDRDHFVLGARRRVPRLAQLAHELAQQSGRSKLPAGALSWHTAWHWSFPTSDREAINVLCAHARRGASGLPLELWEAILGCIQRGWFTPKCKEPDPTELVARAQRVIGRHRPQHGGAF
jgi:hypothetical protein